MKLIHSIKKHHTLAIALAIAVTTGFIPYGTSQAASAAGQTQAMTMQAPPDGAPNGELPPGPPPDGMPGGHGQSGKSASELTASQVVDGQTQSLTGLTLNATAADQSAFLVRNGGSVTLTGSTLSKTGDSSSADASNFSGQNAIFLSSNSTASLSNLNLTSNADGANAIFSTGKNSTVTADHIKIHTKNNSSRGLDSTYGGTIQASNVDITTEGAHCAALATDRGEGNVIVKDARIATSGDGSPCVYSTGNIQLTNGQGEATGSEIAVVEGKNSITLQKVDLTGYKKHGIMLYQSFSGDASVGQATFSAKDSKLTNKSDGPMFYITNTKATATLENTQLVQNGDTLVNVTSGQWGKTDKNGGNFTLNATNQTLKGKILANNISQVTLNLKDHAVWTGSLNEDYAADQANISLTRQAAWNVTSDSYVTTITDETKDFSNIIGNGHTVYYSKADNPSLQGKTFNLRNGGKLAAK